LSVSSWRRNIVAAGVVLLLGVGSAPAHADPSDPSRPAGASKVAEQVRTQLAAKGRADFWVLLSDKADLRSAAGRRDKADRAAYVRQAAIAHAAASQAKLRRLLGDRKARFTPYWVVNAIRVTGDAKLLGDLAARPEVARVVADEPVSLPRPLPGREQATVAGTEWNIARINAPRVWNQLGVRGEGVVVANIDTGVQYDHPALAASYRGRRTGGLVDHNYNWFDPSRICPTAAPCDNNGHGTHTMGTMVGRQGSDEIGVAPGATWMAVKGCESSSCSLSALLAAGQWILAPTDLAGRNPRPDLAPDVVNNSWGANVYDPWYQQIVEAWVAAGIFPAFANGNAGPGCGTSGSPGVYTASYSSGAFAPNDTIAYFSSRGPAPDGTVKPNIAAPGVDVRSSVPGNGYASLSGTSMASPHTAAVVALMWSAAPALDGDIPATRRLLDQTAIDMDDTSCGGTAADNNVWGQGRLDAFAAVDASPWQATGALTGNVTDRGLFPLPDATVSVTGPIHRETITAADGQYRFHRLVPGTYTLTVTKFGFVTATRTVEVVANGTATAVVNLQRVPSARLSGTVYWHGQPAAGATVTIADTPLAVRSDAQGRYGLIVPLGQWEVRAELTDPCSGVAVQRATVTGDTVLDLSLPDRTDRYGYTCGPPVTAYVAGADRVELAGDDVTAPLPLPFPVPLYGVTYGTAWVSTNGVIGFTEPSTAFVNTTVPDPIPPNAALYPFWDDLYVDDEAGIYTTVTGEGAARRLTVEWRNVAFFADRNQRISFTATIEPDGTVTYRYRFVGGVPAVASATIALENADGTDAFTYSYGTPSLPDGSGVTFHPPRIAAGAAR